MIEKKEEVLRQLKLVRKARGISYQMIADGTEDLGMAVSLSSVKRVFAEDSKASDFRYESTIRPIVRFVLGVDGGLDGPDTYEEAKANAEGLAAVVDYKDAVLKRLEDELARVRTDHAITIEKMEAAEARKLSYLMEELQRLREEKKMAEKSAERWRTTSILFLGLFVASLLVVVAYLITDRSHPQWGIFWTDNPVPLVILALLFGIAAVAAIAIARRKK